MNISWEDFFDLRRRVKAKAIEPRFATADDVEVSAAMGLPPIEVGAMIYEIPVRVKGNGSHRGR